MPVSKGRRKPKRVHTVAAPAPEEKKPSPKWYIVLMFALMAIGVIIILLNYMGVFAGGEADRMYLYIGLGCIAAGFLMTLWYR
jgi:hypothetical protein